MTAEQQAIWLDAAMTEDPARYLEAWVYRLSGNVDLPGVRWACRRLLHRHQALRSRYLLDEEGGLVQEVKGVGDCTPMVVREVAEEDLRTEINAMVRRPLDPAQQAVRADLLEVSGDAVLVVQWHHLVADDWSVHVLEAEFAALYRSYMQGTSAVLPPAPRPGPWAQERAGRSTSAASHTYWRTQLAGVGEGVAGSVAHQYPSDAGPGAGSVHFGYEDPCQQLRGVARRFRTTQFVVFTAAVGVWLAIAAGRDDVLVGTAVADRVDPEASSMVTCLTQVMPLRFQVDPDATFSTVLGVVKQSVAGMMRHREISVGDIMRYQRDQTGAFLDTVIVFDGDAAGLTGLDDLTACGLGAHRIHPVPAAAKYGLLITVRPCADGLDVTVDHDTSRYSSGEVLDATNDLLALLRTTLAYPTHPVRDLR